MGPGPLHCPSPEREPKNDLESLESNLPREPEPGGPPRKLKAVIPGGSSAKVFKAGEKFKLKRKVDGKDIAMLRYGDTFSHELPAGPHRVRAHNTLFWKTHEVVLQPGEHARFSAANKPGWGSFGFLMVLGAAPLYLTFEREN